jgi:hypothetical protein
MKTIETKYYGIDILEFGPDDYIYITEKRYVIKFAGHYHGWFDHMPTEQDIDTFRNSVSDYTIITDADLELLRVRDDTQAEADAHMEWIHQQAELN